MRVVASALADYSTTDDQRAAGGGGGGEAGTG